MVEYNTNPSQSHTLAGRSMPLADQSQPKSVPAQPEKEIFKNAARTTKKKRTKCYKEALGKAATKTQQSV